MKLLTQPQARALQIVADHPGCTARQFADLMWPASAGHDRQHRCGNHNAVTTGAPMWRRGGAMLWALRKAGWVSYLSDGPPAFTRFWSPTRAGLRILIEFTRPSTTVGCFIRFQQAPGRFAMQSHLTIMGRLAAGAWLVYRTRERHYALMTAGSRDWLKVSRKTVQDMMAWGWLDEGAHLTAAAKARVKTHG